MTVSDHRLRWLCRRGMLELDAWLMRFVDLRHADLSADQRALFASLLHQDDMDLFDWITGERASPAEFRAIVEAIKTTRYPKNDQTHRHATDQ